MGFYGSIYYQIANAFAKILVNNQGKNNKSFPDINDITENDIPLEADGRNGTAQLASGNKWIQLIADKNNNSCTFYHAPADATDADSFVIPFQKVVSPTPTILENAESLDGGSCFETPVIYYDDAGHLISSGYTKYFKIPKTDYEQSLEGMQSDISDLKRLTNEHTSKINNMNANINGQASNIQNLSQNINNLQDFAGNKESYANATGYTTLTQGIQDIQSLTIENTTSFQNLYNDLADLKERVRALENKG